MRTLGSFEIKGTLSAWAPDETELTKCPCLKHSSTLGKQKSSPGTIGYILQIERDPLSKRFGANIFLVRKTLSNFPLGSPSQISLHRRSLRCFLKGGWLLIVAKPVVFWIHWALNYCPPWAKQINLGPLLCPRRNKEEVTIFLHVCYFTVWFSLECVLQCMFAADRWLIPWAWFSGVLNRR